MAEVHVHPNRLPCDEESSFVVVLKHPLPQRVTDYSLMFKGLQSGREILGGAVKVDKKTLVGNVGAYGKAEEVEVRVVGLATSVRVDPFRITFCTRFQLICSLFPEDIPLQAPIAVAWCMHGHDASVDDDEEDDEAADVMDDELADFCQRNTPTDLSFRKFFGGDLEESMGGKATLLHFAAARGLKQFAAYLLAESGGAYDAIQAKDKDGLTPSEVARRRRDEDMKQLFIDYQDVAACNAVPLTEYADFHKMMSDYNYVKMEQGDGVAKSKDLKKRKKNLLARVLMRKSQNKGKLESSDNKPKKKSFFHSFDLRKIKKGIVSRLETLKQHKDKDSTAKMSSSTSLESIPSHTDNRRKLPLPPPPEESEGSLFDDDDDDGQLYEDIDLDFPSRQGGPPQPGRLYPGRPKSHYMKKIIAKGMVVENVIPSAEETNVLRLTRGHEVNIVEDHGGPWLIGMCNGQEGRVKRSAIHFFDPDYEADVGGAMQEVADEEFYEDISGANRKSGKQQYSYVALHDWNPENEGDLQIYEGDALEVLETTDTGWWVARDSFGHVGTVPSTYLKEEHPSKSVGVGVGGSKSSGGSVSSGDVVPVPNKIVKPLLPSVSAGGPPPSPLPSMYPPFSPGRPPKPGVASSPISNKKSTLPAQGSKKVKPKDKPAPSTLPRQPSREEVTEKSDLEISLAERRKKLAATLGGIVVGAKNSSPPVTKPKNDRKFSTSPQSPSAVSFSLSPVAIPPPPVGKKPALPGTGAGRGKAIKPPPAVAKKPAPVEKPKPVSAKPAVAGKPGKPKNPDEYRCLWDYEPESPDDLQLCQGDIVIVTERSNKDWWIGKCRGKKGVFPMSYVEKRTS
eukprot:m.56781 g.56781  ORF g.56781 m.56781 type:complete len:848 (+) comp34652_c0_seq3:545-3088(+)